MGSRTLTCTTCQLSLQHEIPGFPSAISQQGEGIPPAAYERSSLLSLFDGKQIKTLQLRIYQNHLEGAFKRVFQPFLSCSSCIQSWPIIPSQLSRNQSLQLQSMGWLRTQGNGISNWNNSANKLQVTHRNKDKVFKELNSIR